MNKKEIDEIMEIKKEIIELNTKVRMINHFLRTYSSSFIYEDSIKEIDKIEKYMNEMIEKRDYEEERIQKISETINCEHEILINGFLEYECPICKRKFNKQHLSKYIIRYYYDYEEDEEKINDIIIGSSNDDVCEELLNFFSSKQKNSSIEIKRLTK